jgi:ribosomal protein S18 acetylase RimI-like enzyme
MSEIAIRPAREEDRAAIVALINQLNLHEAALCDDRRTDLAAAEECHAAILARIAREGGALFVACDAEDAPVGFLSLAFAMDEPFVREELRRYGVVTDLVVAEDRRGSGIGRMLLAEAERRCREQGLRRLLIGALVANAQALASYRASGFGDYMLMLSKGL